MNCSKLTDLTKKKQPYTALLYCAPGVGKTTAIGLIAEKSKGKTLILDVDRTITTALSKKDVVKDISKIDVIQIDNINARIYFPFCQMGNPRFICHFDDRFVRIFFNNSHRAYRCHGNILLDCFSDDIRTDTPAEPLCRVLRNRPIKRRLLSIEFPTHAAGPALPGFALS